MKTTRDTLDTFPKYLLLNATRFADRPAVRFKDYGIWQSWSWAEQLEEVRAFSIGLSELGVRHGDKVAIVGPNRPRLYWTFAAAQALGAIPVPVYADAVAEEMAYVLDHAGARFAVVSDQEQVDKIQSFSDRIPALEHIIYDEPRGLEDYDPATLHSFEAVQAQARERIAADPGAARRWEEKVRAASGEDISAMLYTSGTTARSKGVMLRAGAAVKATLDTVLFDKLTERDSVLAYLPLAWVGDHYLNFAQSYVSGFCMACPESQATVPQDLREIGPTFYFAPPRVFESLLTSATIRMEDASRF
jgi:long-chain acyl-CoA synthetase